MCAMLLVAGAITYRLSRSSDGGGTPEEQAGVAGMYALDQVDWREKLLEQAEILVAEASVGRSESAVKKLREKERAKAEEVAKETSIRLELREDEAFRLQVELPGYTSTGIGRWERNEDLIRLHTETVEGTSDEGPPPIIELLVEDGVLVVQPSPGVPFEHRLVRQ